MEVWYGIKCHYTLNFSSLLFSQKTWLWILWALYHNIDLLVPRLVAEKDILYNHYWEHSITFGYAPENDVWNLSAIVSRPQWVNSWYIGVICICNSQIACDFDVSTMFFNLLLYAIMGCYILGHWSCKYQYINYFLFVSPFLGSDVAKKHPLPCTLAGPMYTGIPLGGPGNTCRVHWNTTGKN